MNAWAIAVLPLVGAIVGAVLQFWLSRATERQKQADSLRTAAYVDYLRAVAASAHLRSDEDLRDALRDGADAKARIAVYGTLAVIRALAEFELCGATIEDARSRGAFLGLVCAMRSNYNEMNPRDMELILFGVDRQDSVL